MPVKFVLMSIVVGVVGSFSVTSGAGAAPQPLALMSTQGGVELACGGEQCAATFSSFCLLSERRSPPAGTVYRLASTDGIRVTGRDRQGRDVNLDAARVLEMTALRTQVAVRISVAKSHLAELGLSQVSIDVGEQVTLLPVPEIGDQNPLSEAEIALATGPLRLAGSRIVDADGIGAAAVRWMSSLANELPEDFAAEAAVRDAVLESAVSGPLRSLSPEAGEIARDTLATCGLDVQLQIYKSYRSCLEAAHDAYLWNLNADYWQAVRTGS